MSPIPKSAKCKIKNWLKTKSSIQKFNSDSVPKGAKCITHLFNRQSQQNIYYAHPI